MFKNLRNTLLICAFVVVFAAFMGCSGGSSNYVPPPAPEDADVTGFWYMELGMEGDDFFGPLTMVPMNGDPDDGDMFRLIVEFPVEQGEDGSFSYIGPAKIMGVFEDEVTIEGQVDGDSVIATADLGWATLTFQGTVDGNTITGTWTGTEGEGIDIAVKGLKMKALTADEEMSGTFTVDIGDREHLIPRVAGVWEILDMPGMETVGVEPLNGEELPEWLVEVYQEGWVFGADDDFVWFEGVVYLDGTVMIVGEMDGEWFVFTGTLNGNILTGTFEFEDYEYTVANGESDTATIRIHVKPYWHVISNDDASSIYNIFAWDRDLGEMPEEVADALATHPYAGDLYLPINPEAGVDLGYLPPAAGGDYYAWLGADSTGTYAYFTAHSSSFTSDEITVPGVPVPTIMVEPPPEGGTVTLDLDYWYAIETFEGSYDDLFVQILVQGEEGWYVASEFEFTPEVEDSDYDGMLNFATPAEWDGEGWVTGPDQTPSWVHFSQDISEFAGQTIKIRLLSATYDSVLNWFRGHAVDNVTITVNEEVIFFDGFEIGTWEEEGDTDGDFNVDSFSLQTMSVTPIRRSH